MKIKTSDKSTLQVITTDSYTGEGTDDLTIDIYNNLCKDSSRINLDKEEVRKLRDELNEWLDE
ncbi:hypothetical protein MWU76_20680 [Gelidibacter sp. F2691]|nr:hypothetical protein [Gelidibacter sp. F2691]